MFGKKKKKSKARRKPRDTKRVDPATLARRKRIRHVTLGVLISVAVVLGLLAGREWLIRQTLEEKIPPVSKVVMADVPTWLDESAEEEIKQLAMEVVLENPTDMKLAEKVAARLARSLWVKKIAPAGVVNNYDGSLTIRCEFRQPLAMVSGRRVLVRVDRDAMVLPGKFLRTAVQVGKYRQILGVDSDPPEAGQVWSSPDLLAGVDVLRLIDGLPFSKEIAAIDVSNYRGRRNVAKPHIVMITDKQSYINWGRAIGTEGRIEVDYKTKLEHLEGLFIRYGSLNKFIYADLTGRDVRGKLRDGKEVESR